MATRIVDKNGNELLVNSDGTLTTSGGSAGTTAHDAPATEIPTAPLGGYAATSEPSAVTAGDKVRLYVDANGYLQVKVATVTGTVTVTDGGGVISVDDNGSTLSVDDGGASLTVDGTVALSSVPPSSRLTDHIGAAAMTDAIMNGTTAVTPGFFSESVTASDTDQELVALTSAKKIRITSLVAQCAGTATTMTFESSTTTRNHKIPAGANGGQVLGFNPVGWFETAAGESLTVTTGAGSTTEISGTYIKV